MNQRLKDFLEIVPTAHWWQPPPAWQEQAREALSERLITVGFGGKLKLTDAGRAALSEPNGDRS